MKIVNGRISLLGLVSWAVPLAASLLFSGRTGQLTISQPLFKSIMAAVFGGFGAAAEASFK